MKKVKPGCKVVCPVTDSDGEVSHRIGLLTALNSRYATVEFSDGEIVKVGKTKIEAMEEPKKKKASKKKDDSDEKPKLDRIQNYTYQPCVAASGRTSKDTGDTVALMLRGKDLAEVYRIAADILEVSAKSLTIRYSHLNPGQQRMCIGNRLRKVV